VNVAADGPAEDARSLTVVLAVRSMHVPCWVEALASALMDTGFVNLSLLVVEMRPAAPGKASRWSAGRAWRAYRACDLRLRRLVYRGRPDPRAVTDLGRLGFPATSELPDAVDLVIDASGGAACRALARHAGPPVWWFDHDGHEPWPAAVSGYAEVVEGRPVTRCRLLGLAPGSTRPEVLRSGRVATHPLFGAENRVQLLWKSIPLLVQKVRELRDIGVVRCEQGDVPESTGVPQSVSESTSVLLYSFARHVLRSAGFVARRLLWRDQWYLLMASRSLEERPADGHGDLGRRLEAFCPTQALMPPADRYWADPHVVPGSDGRLVLVEEYPYATRRGRIAMLRLTESGQVAEVRTVLERECHLSYPAVFEFANDLYMVPESSELGRVDAYRCTSYPWRWEFATTLLRGVRACDSSVIEHAGRWWLFTTVTEQPWLTPRDNLHVFFTDDPLEGPWRAHPENPVVCDAYGSRSAGRPFVCDGRLYRPSQDCSRGYGYGIRVKEVTTLTESRFEERDAVFLGPTWRDEVVATHTLALDERTTVVDVMRWLPRMPPLA
jgi:hypothetical protein